MEKLDGSFATLVYPFAENYYHWLIESLPGLRSLEPFIPFLDGIFVPKMQRFHLESLLALGVEKTQLVELDENSHFCCRRLYIPSFNPGWAPYSWLPAWLCSKVLPSPCHASKKRIFVSRKDSSWRKVSNENEVMNLLGEHGYERVELSKLSFVEQASLFHSAETIVSVHGAGLTNIIFCQPETTVLEIHPPCWTSFCYIKLADITGCRYYYMNAEEMGLDTSQVEQKRMVIPADNFSQGDDMEIPLSKLRYFLDSQNSKGSKN